MSNPILEFNKEELNWLKSGKISFIELEEGCEHQCLVCARDAPIQKKIMPLDDLYRLTNNLVEVRNQRNIDFLIQDTDPNNQNRVSWFPYFASDPISYPWLFEAVDYFYEQMGYYAMIQTTGWKPYDKVVEDNIEKIIEKKNQGKHIADFAFSIKTTTPLAISSFRRYLKEHPEEKIDQRYRRETNSFFEEFVPAQNLLHFMKMLETTKPGYALQFLNKETSMPELKWLFSFDCVLNMFKWAAGESGFSFPSRRYREQELIGYGRAVKALDLNLYSDAENLQNNFDYFKNPSKHNKEEFLDPSQDSRIIAGVRVDGTLSIYYARSPTSIFCEQLTKDMIRETMKTFNRRIDAQRLDFYSMLKELDGRSLI